MNSRNTGVGLTTAFEWKAGMPFHRRCDFGSQSAQLVSDVVTNRPQGLGGHAAGPEDGCFGQNGQK